MTVEQRLKWLKFICLNTSIDLAKGTTEGNRIARAYFSPFITLLTRDEKVSVWNTFKDTYLWVKPPYELLHDAVDTAKANEESKTILGKIFQSVGDFSEIVVKGLVTPVNYITGHEYNPTINTGVLQVLEHIVSVNEDVAKISTNLSIEPYNLITGSDVGMDYQSDIAVDFENTEKGIDLVSGFVATTVGDLFTGGYFSKVVDKTQDLLGGNEAVGSDYPPNTNQSEESPLLIIMGIVLALFIYLKFKN